MTTALFTVFLAACTPAPGGGSGPPAIVEAQARPDLRVTVSNAGGDPAIGLWVVLDPGSRDARTGDDGVAILGGVVPGSYAVVVDGPGYERATTRIVVGDGDDTELSVTVTAIDTAVGEVSGLVTDALGDELFGVSVRLDGAEVLTDVDGRFAFDGVTPGRHTVSVEPVPGVAGSWSSDLVDVAGGQALHLDVTLPGTTPANSVPIGSETCGFCHPAELDAWSQTAHARPLRTPSELDDAGHPIAADLDGTTVDLSPELGEARLYDVGGEWRVDVDDALGALLGTWVIEDVYGGYDAGAAFVGRQGGGERTLMPFAWTPDGPGALQERGFAAQWTDRWFDADSGVAGAASFDLACGGCHTTGGRLVEGGDFAFVPVQTAPVEYRVGCEACHGDGSKHRQRPSERALSIVNPARMEGSRQIEVCARCHGQYRSDEHPFSSDPGWAADSSGRLAAPDALDRVAVPDRDTFTVVPAARGLADQAGELLASPHHDGTLGYRGSCADCHVAHGTDNPADLRVAPLEARLCTSCHRDLDPQPAQRAHTGHSRFAPGQWTPGACVGCHMPRAGVVARRDPLSMVGDLRAHTIAAWHPDDVVADFDAAGTDTLGPGEVPVPGCLDCHAQAREILAEGGLPFPGPWGDPYRRSTYVNLGVLFDQIWGVP